MLSCSVVVAWLSGVSAVVYGPRREPPKFRGLRSITELAAAEGYEATNIELLTEDGYSLWIHRIGNNTGPPVLFQHGILLAADSWITRPHKDLAFVLLERGYDVWLSNQRGTVYNEYSLHIPKTNPKYWDFSFHEAGYYDLPASIDAVLDKRGVDRLFYIAHSLGTTTFLVMSSCRPEYNSKIKAALLLAPVAYGPTYSEMKPFLRKMVQAAPLTYRALKLLGHYQIGYRTELKILALRLLCGEFSVTQSMCLDVIGLYTGEDRTNLDKNDFHNFIPYGSAGTSIKTLYHLAQNFRSGEFRQFDYGTEGNLQSYQNASPPSYRLNLVTPPVALIWGLNDNFLSETVLGYVNDPMMSTYNEGQPNNWYNMNYPPQYMDSSYNYMMVNNMNQAYNCAVSTSPITTPRKLLCKFNVKEYSPEDLNVKIVNSSIVIKGSHEEKRDEYGLVSRKFTRRLPIPRGILENEIEVNFIPNGILAITAKFLRLPKVRQLPIHRAYEPNNELQRYHEQQYWMNAEEHMPAINLQEPPPVRQAQVENLPSTMLIKMNEQNLYEVQNQEEGTYIN